MFYMRVSPERSGSEREVPTPAPNRFAALGVGNFLQASDP